MSDTATLLRDGRLRFVKIPEVFTRPNIQQGLFLQVPERAADVDSAESLPGLFKRLDFRQQDLSRFNTLALRSGQILPVDEVAKLAADIREGRITDAGVPLHHRLSSALRIVEDRAHPEAWYYGGRISSYAGVVMHDARLLVLKDVLAELVKNGPSGIDDFVSWIRINIPLAVFGPSTDVRWILPFLQLGAELAALYERLHDKKGYSAAFLRSASPRSVLLLADPGEALQAEDRQLSTTRRYHLDSDEPGSGARPLRYQGSRRLVWQIQRYSVRRRCYCQHVAARTAVGQILRRKAQWIDRSRERQRGEVDNRKVEAHR
ncbi:MAG: hypothetical protein ACR2JB_03900 [Bryobacteraceae bacterium]